MQINMSGRAIVVAAVTALLCITSCHHDKHDKQEKHDKQGKKERKHPEDRQSAYARDWNRSPPQLLNGPPTPK
ncbi:MAG TPA: hypothetical protein VGV87_02170 [Blastocatellia bacterium]|jgi:hypothetical protein|nr:hypothetical protein [Blastocatellia bacterium]